ncbi:MAG: lysophospholipid acyltransferase family protein [Deltaproteobacteria bacterium]
MTVKEGIGRDILRLFVWYPLRWLILASPVRTAISILRLMGDLHYSLSRGKKKVLSQNLGRIRKDCPAETVGKISREYLRNHYIDRLFIFIFPRLGANELKRLVNIKGVEHLDSALKSGLGAVLVHGHFGPVHLPLVALARLGYRMKQIGLPSDEGLSWIGRNVAFKLRLFYESKMPAEVINAEAFLRGAFRWLKDNGVLMITGDGTGTDKHVGRHEAFKFFGQDVLFPLGPSILAKKTGAKILPMFIAPGEARFLYTIIIERPLTEDDPRRMTEAFVRRLESYASEYPQYLHFLDRFSPGLLIRK